MIESDPHNSSLKHNLNLINKGDGDCKGFIFGLKKHSTGELGIIIHNGKDKTFSISTRNIN